MGTDDLAERALDQGLIKLAAAGVHAVRGNSTGMARNLSGARALLSEVAVAPGLASAPGADLDVPALVAAIDAALGALAAVPTPADHVPGSPRFGARSPVDVAVPRPARRPGTRAAGSPGA